jgi:hypothetical protein
MPSGLYLIKKVGVITKLKKKKSIAKIIKIPKIIT